MTSGSRFTVLSEAAESLLGRLADEFLAARERGHPQNVDELAAQFPELADVIRQTFPAMLVLRAPPRTSLSKGELLQGEELGDFRLIRELGRGGMGVVYEAMQRSLGRRVALKVLPLAAMLDERRLRRFQNEAHAAAALQHPHIVPVYGVGCERGVHYYAMQLIHGVSLAEVLRKQGGRGEERGVRSERSAPDSAGPPSPVTRPPSLLDTCPLAALSTIPAAGSRDYFRTVARLGIQAAEALAYAHREGVIHRDIKPSNLLLDENGKLWIADFGLARMHTDGELTLSGDLLGTPRYMSPEQLTDNKVVDQRTDVYSLGLTLYELLAGAAAFADVPREQLPQKILSDDPPSLRAGNASIPVDLETIILRATAKDRDARYQSADALAADLQRFVDCKPILARRPNRVQRVRYWARRNPSLATTLALLLLTMAVLSVGGPLMAWRQSQLAAVAAHNLFVSDMNLAYEAWYRGHVDRTEELLARHADQARHGDSRDFPYLHLLGQCQQATGTVVMQSEGKMSDLAISPDGRLLACGGSHVGVTLFESVSGRVLRTLKDTRSDGPVMAFSPDGDLLVTNGRENRIVLWDTRTWEHRIVVLSDDSVVRSFSFAADGQTFAIGTIKGDLTLCRRDGTRVWTIAAHRGNAWATAFSPEGQTLVSVGQDHHVRLWDTANGALIRDLARLAGPTFDVVWKRDGQQILVGSSEGITCLETASGAVLRGLQRDVNSVATLAVHGNLLATGGYDHLLHFWDIESGLLLGVKIANRAQITGGCFSPDGKHVFTAGGDGTIRRFDVADVVQRREHVLRADWEWPAEVAVARDGATCVSVAVPYASDQAVDEPRGEFIVWDVASGTRRRSVPIAPRFGVDVAISHDGRVCATVGIGGIQLWDIDSATPTHVLVNDDSQRFKAVAVSPNGRWLAVGGRDNNTSGLRSPLLAIWDLHARPPQRQAMPIDNPRGQVVFALAFADDSSRLSVARGDWIDGAIDTWSLEYGQWREAAISIATHGETCTGAVFVPGTDLVASAGHDGEIGLQHWRKQIGVSKRLRGHTGGIRSIALANDGHLIASGTFGEIGLWDRVTGDQLGRLQLSSGVSSLAFTPDGQTLIWGGADGSVNFERANVSRASPSD